MLTLALKYQGTLFPEDLMKWIWTEMNWKPYISKNNKMSWLRFAIKHVILTEEQWDCVHFSDESKFKPFGCDGRRFVRHSSKERYSPQCTKSRVKFWGVSVMVFDMIWTAVTGPLIRLHVKLTQLYTKRYWETCT